MPTMNKATDRTLGMFDSVDVPGASPKLRRQMAIVLDSPNFTQNTTVQGTAVPHGIYGSAGTAVLRVIGAQCVFATAPAVAGGTATLVVQKIANDGSTKTALVTATSALGKTANVVFDFTALATALTVNGDEVLNVASVTSNNAVGTQQVGGKITIYAEPIEDSTITDTLR